MKRAECRELTCKACGITFNSKADHGAWPKFCSRACFLSQCVRPQEKQCATCGKRFLARSRTDRDYGFQKFCSRTCKEDGHKRGNEYKCMNCGTPFYLSPSALRQRGKPGCCSRECQKIFYTGVRSAVFGIKNKKLSEALKKKWASGTRKPTPRSAYAKASATNKKAFAEGRRKRPTWTTERARELRAMVDYDEMVAINRRIGQEKIGSLNPPGPSARGPGHFKAKYFILETPNGDILHGWNLAELIRSNAHLFTEADLMPDDKDKALEGRYVACRAYKRLHQLFEIRKSTGEPYAYSWKGWRGVTSLDAEPPRHIVNFPTWENKKPQTISPSS